MARRKSKADPSESTIPGFAKMLRVDCIEARALDPQGLAGYARRVWLRAVNTAALLPNPFWTMNADGGITRTLVRDLPDTAEGCRGRLVDSACMTLLDCMRRGTMTDAEAKSIRAIADVLSPKRRRGNG